MSKLRVTLLALLTMAACSPSTSSKGQLITCSTDPATGVVLSCEPGAGSDDPNSCQDIDEDGDGDPHDDADEADDASERTADGSDDDTADEADSDGDGIADDRDCDEHQGEDDDD